MFYSYERLATAVKDLLFEIISNLSGKQNILAGSMLSGSRVGSKYLSMDQSDVKVSVLSDYDPLKTLTTILTKM